MKMNTSAALMNLELMMKISPNSRVQEPELLHPAPAAFKSGDGVTATQSGRPEFLKVTHKQQTPNS